MNEREAAQVVATLTAGFQGAGERFTEANMAVWYDGLRDLEAGSAVRAASEWIRAQPRFPTVFEFREVARAVRRRELSSEKPLAALDAHYLPLEENKKRLGELKEKLAELERKQRAAASADKAKTTKGLNQ